MAPPRGADSYLRWRRSIDEHLELRRLTWDEYAMFNWLCTKASPRTGSVRTSWPTLSEQTGLSADHVEQLCRRLKRKRYIWYPLHRGRRGRLIEVSIDKFPLVQGTYTDLSHRFAEPARALPTEAPTHVAPDPPTDLPTEVPAELLTDLAWLSPAKSRGAPSGRKRSEDREQERARSRLRPGVYRWEWGRAEDDAERAARERPPLAIRDLLARAPLWRAHPDDQGEPRMARPDA